MDRPSAVPATSAADIPRSASSAADAAGVDLLAVFRNFVDDKAAPTAA